LRQRGSTEWCVPWQFCDLALFAATHSSPRAAPGPSVRARALASGRHSAAVPKTAIAPDIHQALDVHRDFSPQVTFDPHLLVHDFTNAVDFIVRQIPHARIRAYIRALEKLLAGMETNTKNVRQRRLDSLVAR
jgi:hypothetical protein